MGPLRIFTFDDEDMPDVSTGYVSATDAYNYANDITDTLNNNLGCWVMSFLKTRSGMAIGYGNDDKDNVVAKYTSSGILYITFNFVPDKSYWGCSKIYLNDLFGIIPKNKIRNIVIRYGDTYNAPYEFILSDNKTDIQRPGRITKDLFLELVRFDCDMDTMPSYIIFDCDVPGEKWVLNSDDGTYYSEKWGTRSTFPIKFW